jgi:predicted amidophosphoribosyltransferase
MERLAKERCDVCDRPRQDGANECGNPICNWPDRFFERNYAIAMRSGILQQKINNYKYDNKKEWALIFARVLVGHLQTHHAIFSQFDIIVASPHFTGPGATRTWDHTRLVLEHATQLVPGVWPFDLQDPPVIIKTANTEPLAQARTWRQRYEVATGPIRDSLRVTSPLRTRGKRILVYDDVFTDGQTLNEVARALRLMGEARSVCGITLARQPWRR